MNSILVVDDDEVFTRVLSASLREKGYEVDTVNKLEEILPALQDNQFDTILLDLMLAEQSSLNLITEILQHQPEARITVITGFASIATTVQAMKMGAVGYLAKPVGIRDILTVLHADNGADDDAAEIDLQGIRPMPLRRVEWEHIQRVLADHDGNISAAARSLGIHRRSLQRKLLKKPPGSLLCLNSTQGNYCSTCATGSNPAQPAPAQ